MCNSLHFSRSTVAAEDTTSVDTESDCIVDPETSLSSIQVSMEFNIIAFYRFCVFNNCSRTSSKFLKYGLSYYVHQ